MSFHRSRRLTSLRRRRYHEPAEDEEDVNAIGAVGDDAVHNREMPNPCRCWSGKCIALTQHAATPPEARQPVDLLPAPTT